MSPSRSLGLALPALAALAGLARAASIRAVLPAEGLIGPSVVEFRRQSALDPHYFLADEAVLGLDGRAEAVFARYRADGGEALVLALAYPDPEAAARVQGRFGGDFFSPAYDPARARFVEALESGDFAGIARVGPVLVVVLEAPSREACDGLLRRLEDRAGALRRPLDSGSRAGLS